MKKVLIAVIALLALGSSVFAGSTNTYTNVYNQVVTVVVGDDGTLTTSIVPAVSPDLAYRTEIPLVGIQVSTGTTVTATAFTPRDIGDILIGTVSNKVYMSTGATTNDWVELE